MKPLHIAIAIGLCTTLAAHAQTPAADARAPSDEDIARLLTPSEQNRQSWTHGWSFEKDTDVPALKIQNLPLTQMAFRIGALKAVSKSIQDGAYMALKVYSPEDFAMLGWKRISIPREQSLFRDSTSVVLLHVDDRSKSVQIAIRGTENLDDAIFDLKANAVLDEELGIRLHSGFRTLSREILQHLKKHNLSNAVLNSYSFSLYGHSLGGAIASIMSMYLHQSGSKVTAVVTFGAPRFTTNEGARKYQVLNQVTHRIVRCDDAVPFMPPPNFFGWSNESYQANGSIFLLLKPPYFDYSVGIDIERDFTYQLRLDLENRDATKMLAYGHRMNNYFSLLIDFMPRGLMANAKREEGVFGYTSVPDLQPVTYTLALQSKLCPAQTAAVR
jgi:pimeloyl-ACP methyl ester carboxylesterase